MEKTMKPKISYKASKNTPTLDTYDYRVGKPITLVVG